MTRSRRAILDELPGRDNGVLLAVSDQFGGWALTGRLEPGDAGVLVSGRPGGIR
jgi:hypothetical protein